MKHIKFETKTKMNGLKHGQYLQYINKNLKL